MPLPGFSVIDDQLLDREFSFKLMQARKVLLFAASSKDQKERWIYVFKRAGQGEELTREDVYKTSEEGVQSLNEEVMNDISNRLSSSSGDSASTTVSTNGSSKQGSSGDSNSVSSDVNGISRASSSIFSEISDSH